MRAVVDESFTFAVRAATLSGHRAGVRGHAQQGCDDRGA